MIDVACAVVQQEGLILVCQRSEKMRLPLTWEFPGGKLEAGETLEECIKREVWEELEVHIAVYQKLDAVVHQYADFSTCLHPFLSHIIAGDLNLKEHAQYKWCTPAEAAAMELCAADQLVLKQL
ncbi:MAG: (deoxy)nucleoside triphosphate pyrophosphohydrolase [Flavobacterium sp.]|nr:(deoxy)nucleoside triphosphate pyrophosphohydrolase [Candidatus Neoflavobacterium equi]